RVSKRLGEIDPNVLSVNLSEAMKLVVHACDVRIAIHPKQRETFLAALPQLKLQWPALEHVELIEDLTVSPGGCRILTRGGEVDANLDRQIDRIAADLLPNSPSPRMREVTAQRLVRGRGEGSLSNADSPREEKDPSP